MNLSQTEFAQRYRINVETLRSWDQDKRTPPDYAVAYLLVIQDQADTVSKALRDTHRFG